jgi:hypothetical protein
MKKLLCICGLCAVAQLQAMNSGNNDIETRLAYIRLMRTLAEANLHETDNPDKPDLSKRIMFGIAVKKGTLSDVYAGSDSTDWPTYETKRVASYEPLTNPALLEKMQKLFAEEAQEQLVILDKQIALLKKQQ